MTGRGRSSPGRCTRTTAGTRRTCWPRPSANGTQEAVQRRRRSLMRKELAWLRRGPQARSTKPKFRVQAASALIADEPPPRDTVELTSLATARLGKTVIDVEDVTLWAGPRVLLDDVTWRLAPGERAGLVGVNGSGKTSLLRLLDGSLVPGRPGAANPPGGPPAAVRAEGTVVGGRPCGSPISARSSSELDPDAPGARDRAGRAVVRPGRQARAVRQPDAGAVRLPRRPAVDRPSAICPAANGAGCSCSGC